MAPWGSRMKKIEGLTIEPSLTGTKHDIYAIIAYPWSRSCPGNSARSNGLQELSEWNVTAFKILSFNEVTVVESTPKIIYRMAGWLIHEVYKQDRKTSDFKVIWPHLVNQCSFPWAFASHNHNKATRRATSWWHFVQNQTKETKEQNIREMYHHYNESSSKSKLIGDISNKELNYQLHQGQMIQANRALDSSNCSINIPVGHFSCTFGNAKLVLVLQIKNCVRDHIPERFQKKTATGTKINSA